MVVGVVGFPLFTLGVPLLAWAVPLFGWLFLSSVGVLCGVSLSVFFGACRGFNWGSVVSALGRWIYGCKWLVWGLYIGVGVLAVCGVDKCHCRALNWGCGRVPWIWCLWGCIVVINGVGLVPLICWLSLYTPLDIPPFSRCKWVHLRVIY